MNTNEAKRIRIEEYLHTLGYNPVRRQGDSLWYKSPFRDEQEPSAFILDWQHCLCGEL